MEAMFPGPESRLTKIVKGKKSSYCVEDRGNFFPYPKYQPGEKKILPFLPYPSTTSVVPDLKGPYFSNENTYFGGDPNFVPDFTSYYDNYKHLLNHGATLSPELYPDFSKLPFIHMNFQLDKDLMRFLSSTKLIRNTINPDQQGFVDFDSLNGKYWAICCFPVPLLAGFDLFCRAVIDSYNVLSSQFDFELILVLKRNGPLGDYDEKFVFDHFLSAFPPCLTIPFSNSEARDYLCSSIGLSKGIVVDPDGVVLYNSMTMIELEFGCEWTSESGSLFLQPVLLQLTDHYDRVWRRGFDMMYDRHIKFQPPLEEFGGTSQSLSQILNLHPHDIIHRFDGGGSMLRDLENKLVGVYICVEGEFMEKLKEVHDHCLANNRELEIVLVCMPLYDEPDYYMEDLSECVELFNLHSWFLVKYQSTSCRRIQRIFGQAHHEPEDSFIIVHPNGQHGELEGKLVITTQGIDAYPFTRSILLKERFKALRWLKPTDSSLPCEGTNEKYPCFHNVREVIPMLQGKNFLLYLDNLSSEWINIRVYKLMKEFYSELKALDWEVVFVPLDVNVESQFLEEMPWPQLPPSSALVNCVMNHLLFPVEMNGSDRGHDISVGGHVISVGKDDKILSRRVIWQLDSFQGTKCLSKDLLYEELARGLSYLDRYLD